MIKYEDNWEDAKKHFEAYWNKDYLERCCLAMYKGREGGKPIYMSREYTIEERYTDPQYLHESMMNGCATTEYLCEAIPSRIIDFGTAGECQYFVGMNDNCGIIDALAHLRGTENLLYDMVEEPDFVHAARDKIISVWKETQAEIFEVVKNNNLGGSSHSWMHLWSPARHLQLQCDYSCMISPKMFEEFVLPELEQTASAFEHASYHLDGIEQIRHLDMILSVKSIDNIQWTRVAGQPKTSANIEALRKIQKAGKGLVLFPDRDEIEFLMKNLSHKGLQLIIGGVKDKQEADEIVQLAKSLAHGSSLDE